MPPSTDRQIILVPYNSLKSCCLSSFHIFSLGPHLCTPKYSPFSSIQHNMGAGGVVLRFFNLGLRVLQFLDAAVVLGIFSYFLAVLSRNNQTIETWIKAVEGLAGAATAYSLLGVIFTCCLGGVAFFAFLGVALDVCFVGAMVAIAILTRKGVSQCTGTVETPMGTGNANDDTASKGLKFGMACKLEKVVFAVAIIGM